MKYYKIIEKATGEYVVLSEEYAEPLWVVLKDDDRFCSEEIAEEEINYTDII